MQLDKMAHISGNQFKALDWFPVKDIFSQSINSTVLTYCTNQCPSYLNEIFESAWFNELRTRNRYLKLILPFR